MLNITSKIFRAKKGETTILILVKWMQITMKR